MKSFCFSAIFVVAMSFAIPAHAQRQEGVREKETTFKVARGELRVVELWIHGVLEMVIAKGQKWPEEFKSSCVNKGRPATCWTYSAPPKASKDVVLYDRSTRPETAGFVSIYLPGPIHHTVRAILPIGDRKVIYITDGWIWLYQRGIFDAVSGAGGNFDEVSCEGDVCSFSLEGSGRGFDGVLFLEADPDAWKVHGWSYPHDESREPLHSVERANYSDKAPRRAQTRSVRKLPLKGRNWYLITHKGDSPSQHLQTVLNADTGELWPQQF